MAMWFALAVARSSRELDLLAVVTHVAERLSLRGHLHPRVWAAPLGGPSNTPNREGESMRTLHRPGMRRCVEDRVVEPFHERPYDLVVAAV